MSPAMSIIESLIDVARLTDSWNLSKLCLMSKSGRMSREAMIWFQ